MTIRAATAEDLSAILDLADARRTEYANYQPAFWRPAPNARQHQEPHLAGLINSAAVITVVAVDSDRVVGFAIAEMAAAPPVYDPGGLTCVLDDFAVDHPDRWLGAGLELLHHVRRCAAELGAVQVVVVCGHLDQPKRSALTAAGLAIASEWWVGPASAPIAPS